MITLEEIFERMKKHESKDEPSDEISKYVNRFKPVKLEDYTPPDFYIRPAGTNKGDRTRWAKKLGQILAFVKLAQKKRYKNAATIMPIPTTSEEYKEIWGSDVSVLDGISRMIEMGLVERFTPKKRFGSDKSYSYTYIYYVETEAKFLEFCEENGIKPYEKNKKSEDSAEEAKEETKVEETDYSEELANFDRSKVKIKTNLRLSRPSGMSIDEFESFLAKCLRDNYPQIPFFEEVIKKINSQYSEEEKDLCIRFKPHFRWGGKGKRWVNSIGLRASNKLVGVKKEDRWEILSEYDLRYSHDIRSSVPRVTASLNHGKWENEVVDLYTYIYYLYDIYSKSGTGFHFDENLRDIIKGLHMRTYFDDKSDKKLAAHVWKKMDKEGASYADVIEEMTKLRKAVVEIEGKRLNNYVFLAESCIYLRVVEMLMGTGFRVWFLYDCFYVGGHNGLEKEEFDELVENLVESSFKWYYETYYKMDVRCKRI